MFRCLGPGTVEEIVAREGEELISRFLKTNAENYFEAICGLKKFILLIPRVEEGVRQSPGSEKFSHRFCQVKLLCQKNQIFIIYILRCLEDIFLEPATAVSALRWAMIIMVMISVKLGDIGEIGPKKSYLGAPGDGDDDEIVPPKNFCL